MNNPLYLQRVVSQTKERSAYFPSSIKVLSTHHVARMVILKTGAQHPLNPPGSTRNGILVIQEIAQVKYCDWLLLSKSCLIK